MRFDEVILDKQDYGIDDELKICEILNTNTNDKLIFSKNNNKYEIDLECKSTESSNVLGYVEIERATSRSSWVDGWSAYSFLFRKLFQWDWDKNQFIPKPLHKGALAFYLKFNYNFNDCFCVKIKDIQYNGKRSERSDGRREYTYGELPIHSPHVIRGIDNCMKYIEEAFLEKLENEQKDFSQNG